MKATATPNTRMAKMTELRAEFAKNAVERPLERATPTPKTTTVKIIIRPSAIRGCFMMNRSPRK
jgi:hypothetical protein